MLKFLFNMKNIYLLCNLVLFGCTAFSIFRTVGLIFKYKIKDKILDTVISVIGTIVIIILFGYTALLYVNTQY